jgi:hypothetical protein
MAALCISIENSRMEISTSVGLPESETVISPVEEQRTTAIDNVARDRKFLTRIGVLKHRAF